jgi:cytochrome b6-f complex iron-sulfur subunit
VPGNPAVLSEVTGEIAMEEKSRRRFLGLCLGVLGTAFAGAAAYPVFRYLAPRKTGEAGRRVELAAKEIPEGGATFFEFNGKTAVIIRKKGGSLVALSAVCTHLGCIVQWQKEHEEFLCPCHAGRFSAEGAVLGGPPPRPLDKLPLVEKDGTAFIG